MGKIIVVAEHRKGELADITFEMLHKGRELSKILGHTVTAVLFGSGVENFAQELSKVADEVILVEDESLDVFNWEVYRDILDGIIKDEGPAIIMIGHTAWGMNLAPGLAFKSGLPLATDCVDITCEGDRIFAIREIYSGKIFSKVSFREESSVMVTIRPGSFPAEPEESAAGKIVRKDFAPLTGTLSTRFIEYAESPAGDVDITQADCLVSVGRGIGEEENIDLVRDLAKRLGAVLSCSRPIVDKNWLPKYLQVGTSGKTVKPKAYIAIGISGAFQHIAGMKGSGTIIAINKDPKAPIFREADYGIVGDIFEVVPALIEKATEMHQ